MEDDINRRFDIKNLKSQSKRSPQRRIEESVFDTQTLMALGKLMRKKAFESLGGVVSQGKEAVVFHGTGDLGDVAVKIYMVETSDFKNMSAYVRGDPRFPAWRNRRQLVYMWAQKEFKNLSRICADINCPKPIDFFRNVLVMQFIGSDGTASPRLRDKPLSDPQRTYDKILSYIRGMLSKRLVHADLSEYNILIKDGEPVIIDLSTGVLLEHPRSSEFLERDIRNVTNYFSRLGADADHDLAMEAVCDAL